MSRRKDEPTRSMVPLPLQFLAAWLAVWLGRVLQQKGDYLTAEDRVLRVKLGGRKLRLTDAERCRLAVLGKELGRKALAKVATIATSETIVRRLNMVFLRRRTLLRSSLLIAFMLTACGRSELLPETQDSSSIAGRAGMGGPASPTDAASLDTSVPTDECTGESKPNGCPCTNGAECEDGFCATDYAPRSGSSECEQAEVGRCRDFPQHDCVCMVTSYGNRGHCYE